MTIKYWQRSRKPGAKQPPGTIYCGRPTQWGNPYTGEGAVEKYRAMAESMGEFILPELLASAKYLSCWCAPGAPCHVQDVLIPAVNALLEAV